MSKVKGELAEMMFQVEATKREYVVSKPFGDNQTYDFIVEKEGIVKRVQIKSTSHGMHSRRGVYQINIVKSLPGSKRTGGAYQENDFDILAIQVVPLNEWYIIPMKEILNKTGIGIGYTDSKYNQYKEAWNLLRE